MKHTVTVILLIISLTVFSSCTRENRFDRSELSLRLSEIDESYAFSYDKLLIEESVSRVYYSLTREDDALLSLTEDDEGRLTCIELTILAKDAGEALTTSFEELCMALTRVFLSEDEENARTLCTGAGLFSKNTYFTDTDLRQYSGRYTVWLWSCPLSMSFILTYSRTPVEKQK